MDGLTVTLPDIKAVELAPNPAQAGAAVLITAAVGERTVTLYPEIITSGELCAGE